MRQLMTIILGAVLGAGTASAACNEAALRLATDRYVASQSTGSLQWLGKVLSNGTAYLENGKILGIRASNTSLASGMAIDHQHSIYDTT